MEQPQQPQAQVSATVIGGEKFETEKRFDESKPTYNDLWASILFGVICVLGVIIVAAIGNSEPVDDTTSNSDSNSTVTYNSTASDYEYDGASSGELLTVFGAEFGCAFLVAMGWLGISRAFPEKLVWFTLSLGIILSVIIAVVSLAYGNIGFAVVMLVVAAINALIVYLWRKRIPFAAALLKISCELTQKYPATIGVAVASEFVMLFYFVLWIFAAIRGFINVPDDDSMKIVAEVILVISVYWAPQVFSNTAKVTNAGCFASWYFLANTPNMMENPTQKSLKRATTWSFGSVCFGSLLMAIAEMIRSAANDNESQGYAALMFKCILNLILDLLEAFTSFALVTVAIYGEPFIPSAKRTWELCKSRGVDALINQSIISAVFTLGIVVGGLVTCFAGVMITQGFSDEIIDAILMGILGFVVGCIVVALILGVVDTAVMTIFVCYAEDPQPLANSNPETYNMLSSADQQM